MLNIFATTQDLEHTISQLSKSTVFIASVLLVILVILSIWAVRTGKKKLFKPLYVSIIVVASVATLTISGATIYLNIRSATGGPVHWHADIEYWVCNNELELRDPQGVLSNKIGTPTLHEHNDKRIHLEGVPVNLPHDASLGKFMEVVGGEVSRNTLVVPLNNDKLYENGEDETDGDGPADPNPQLLEQFISQEKDGKIASFVNGQKCGDEAAEVQVFAYQFNEDDKTYRQTKLDDPANYAVSGHSEVPPGDCIIFEFAPPMERTDKLCEQYGVRDIDQCEEFGVKPDESEICEIREVQ
jgi:hypothetical protein